MHWALPVRNISRSVSPHPRSQCKVMWRRDDHAGSYRRAESLCMWLDPVCRDIGSAGSPGWVIYASYSLSAESSAILGPFLQFDLRHLVQLCSFPTSPVSLPVDSRSCLIFFKWIMFRGRCLVQCLTCSQPLSESLSSNSRSTSDPAIAKVQHGRQEITMPVLTFLSPTGEVCMEFPVVVNIRVTNQQIGNTSLSLSLPKSFPPHFLPSIPFKLNKSNS